MVSRCAASAASAIPVATSANPMMPNRAVPVRSSLGASIWAVKPQPRHTRQHSAEKAMRSPGSVGAMSVGSTA
ncbi:Uncharacterised protein [Mycobacteroides abscessus]|nr:Uncharacterised protein [Mycobacteroides abscessus]